ncbi:hypothetical protein MHAE_10948 [Mycobacterium haemophilum DSM 44634]
MPADTSSAAAAIIPVVDNAAAALAELIAEPMLAKSFAATDTASGTAVTKDMPQLPTQARRSAITSHRKKYGQPAAYVHRNWSYGVFVTSGCRYLR